MGAGAINPIQTSPAPSWGRPGPTPQGQRDPNKRYDSEGYELEEDPGRPGLWRRAAGPTRDPNAGVSRGGQPIKPGDPAFQQTPRRDPYGNVKNLNEPPPLKPPTPAYEGPKYNTNTPGNAEDYYKANAYRWTQPPPSANYWNDVGGQFNDPWAGETQALNTLGEMGSQGALEANIGSFQQRLQAPTASGDVFSRLSGKGPGAMENFWEQNQAQLSGPSSLAQNRNQVLDNIHGARNLEDFWDETSGDLKRPGYTENLADQYRPEFSYSEDLLLGGGGMEGLDRLYGRLSETGGRRLDDRAAAAGGFNSGAALAARSELERDLAAQQIKDVIGLADQADTQKRSRLDYGLNLMSGADEGLRGRIGLGFQGGEAVDRISLARAEALQNLFQGEGSEMRDNLALGGKLANDSQSASTAFDQLLVSSGRAKDDVFKNLMELENTATRDTQRAWQDRLTGQINASSVADNLRGNRIELGSNLAQTAGDQSLNYLDSGMTAAIGADTGKLARQNQQWNQVMSYIEQQLGIHTRNFEKGQQEKWDTFMAGLAAQVKNGDITAEQAMGMARQYAEHLDDMIDGAKGIDFGGGNDGGPKESGGSK